MSAFTPNFQLEFIAPGEPIRNTRAVLERMTKSIDAALTRGGVAPPNAQDLVAVAGRTTTLEDRATALEGRATALESPPHFTGYLAQGATPSVINWAPIPLGAELVDTHSGHSPTANPERYTAPKTGYYRCSGQCAYAITPAGGVFRGAMLVTNGRDAQGGTGYGGGGPVLGSAIIMPYSNGGTFITVPVVPRRIYLTAGQWVSLYGYSNASTTLAPWNAADVGQATFLEVTYDGP